jgi:hypothetical protein
VAPLSLDTSHSSRLIPNGERWEPVRGWTSMVEDQRSPAHSASPGEAWTVSGGAIFGASEKSNRASDDFLGHGDLGTSDSLSGRKHRREWKSLSRRRSLSKHLSIQLVTNRRWPISSPHSRNLHCFRLAGMAVARPAGKANRSFSRRRVQASR